MAPIALALATNAESEKSPATAPASGPAAREWAFPGIRCLSDIQVAGDHVFLTESFMAEDRREHLTTFVLNIRTGICKDAQALLPAAHRDRVAIRGTAVAPDGKRALMWARSIPQDAPTTEPATMPATLYLLDVGSEKATAVQDFAQTTRPATVFWRGNDRFIILPFDADLTARRSIECDASGKRIAELPVYVFPLAATTNGQMMLAGAPDPDGIAHPFKLGALQDGAKLLLLDKDYKVRLSLDCYWTPYQRPILSPSGKFFAAKGDRHVQTSFPTTQRSDYGWRVFYANGEVAYKITEQLHPLQLDDSGEFLAYVWYATDETGNGSSTTHGVSRLVRWNAKGEKTVFLDSVVNEAAISGDTVYYVPNDRPPADGKAQCVLRAAKLSELK
jgi:hypothetical protein